MRFVRKAVAAWIFSIQISLLFSLPVAFAETIELVTYYPAPPAAAGNGLWTAAANGTDIYNTNTGGNVGIGTTTPRVALNVVSERPTLPLVSFDTYDDVTGSSELWLTRARGTLAAPAAVQSNDRLGALRFSGCIGPIAGVPAFRPGAAIQGISAGAAGTSIGDWTSLNTPAHLVFSTVSPGTNGLVERVRITAEGSVGIGSGFITTLPDPTLGLTESLGGILSRVISNDAGTFPVFRLERALGANLIPAAVGPDVTVGALQFRGHDETNYRPIASIIGETDVSTGIGLLDGRLVFSTTSTGVTPQERMRITNVGNVGIGDTSPAALLTVGDGDRFRVDNAGLVQLPSGTAAAPSLSYTGDTNTGFFRAAADTLAFSTNGTERMRIAADGSVKLTTLAGVGPPVGVQVDAAGVLSRGDPIVSSRIYKQDIHSLQVNPAEVLRLNPVRFRWKQDGSPDIGLVAEEVDQVLKDLVTYDGKGRPEGVRYDKLSLYLLEVVKEQQKRIQHLEKSREPKPTSSGR